MKAMKLSKNEKVWLDKYRCELKRRFPGLVERLLVYGSKARGDAGPDSDLDLLLIVKDQAARRKLQLRWIGYMLAADTDVVPSILAYTTDEWERRRQSRSPFRRAVERDAVRVL